MRRWGTWWYTGRIMHAKKNSKTQDIALLVSSFIIGTIAGSYLYVTGFAPKFEDAEIPRDITTAGAFTIEAESYGGMRLMGSQPAYRLTDTGEYRYVPFAEMGAAVLPVAGSGH